MRFRDIFDREASVDFGLFPIWIVLTVLYVLSPWFERTYKVVPLGSIIIPVGWLIGLHWLFRLGKWIEFSIQSSDDKEDRQ
jgi:hypothetical protein